MTVRLQMRWEVLDQWLAAQDWKDQRFAEALGIDQSYLSLLRNGKRVPSFETLEAFFAVTSLEPSRLLMFTRDADGKKNEKATEKDED